MDVLILAGGFGTRLYPITENLPKALIEIKKKPIIEYVLKKLEETKEVKNIYILSNSKFYINFLEWLSEFKKREKISEKIKILNNGVNREEDKKGAVGDLKFGLKFINGQNLLVLASDNLFDFDLRELFEISKNKNSSIIALKKIQDKELIKKYSCVLLDEQEKIIYFEEKPEVPRSNICSVACYLLKKEDVEKIRNHDFDKQDNMGNIIEFLHKESKVYGNIFKEFWCDIGSEKDLEKAELYFKTLNSF